jgi:hypothetical protein
MATMSADETITRFAQRHRLRAAAALVQIVNDEDASASARVAASQSILAYSDGKPGVTKHVTPSDVMAMTTEERHSLWRALFEVETDFPAFVIERINDTVQREARRLTTAKINRFTRGEPEPRPTHVPPPRERRASGAPKPPGDPPHRQPPPPPSPQPPPLPPATKGNVSETNTPAANGHAFAAANFSNADYDAAGRPLHKIGYGEPSPRLGITTMTPGATGATGRGRG